MLLINALKYGSAVVGEERGDEYTKHGNSNSNTYSLGSSRNVRWGRLPYICWLSGYILSPHVDSMYACTQGGFMPTFSALTSCRTMTVVCIMAQRQHKDRWARQVSATS